MNFEETGLQNPIFQIIGNQKNDNGQMNMMDTQVINQNMNTDQNNMMMNAPMMNYNIHIGPGNMMNTFNMVTQINMNNQIPPINIGMREMNQQEQMVIWIDRKVDNNENKNYINRLNKISQLKGFSSIEQGLNEILNIKFKKVILILSHKMFNEFIPKFEIEKNKICCCLNIIVFTQANKKSLVTEISNKNKDISSGYIFDKTNIFDDVSQIIDFIKRQREGKNENMKIFEISDIKKEILFDDTMNNFENYEYIEELILPLYFHKLIEPPTLEEIHNFNNFLLSSFGKNGKEVEELISQFENMAEMPIEILCKYWLRVYTLASPKFYSILNYALKNKRFKLFLPFIKMSYEGVKRKVFDSKISEKLYSGGGISKLELEGMRNVLNSQKKVFYYSKSFISFSKIFTVAKGFIDWGKKDCIPLLFILDNKNIVIDGVSNAYLKEFSLLPNEEEVLFFPFSFFEIEKIEDKIEGLRHYVIITLKYLSQDIPNFKYNIFKDIPITQFGRDITEMGLIKYKFIKFWEVEKQKLLERNATCLLVFEKNKLVFSLGNVLKLYDINRDEYLCQISEHQGEIKDLLQINNNTFISSLKNNKIKFIELINNFTSFNEIKSIEFHNNEVNQTIKLKDYNLYASCSDDKTIKIWKYSLGDNNGAKLKNILINKYKVLSICELPNLDIVSILENGYLKFWEYKNNNYSCAKKLKGFKNCLHKCIFSLNEEIILVGTKKYIFLIDINMKIKIKRFVLDYNSYSIGYLNDHIFLGLKNNSDSCLLFEYNIEKKYEEFNLECIGKGRDICSQISFIDSLDEKKIITCNKNNYIKIWKETDKKPEFLQIEKNPSYNFEEGYDSDNSEEGGNQDNKDGNDQNEIKESSKKGKNQDNKDGSGQNENNINEYYSKLNKKWNTNEIEEIINFLDLNFFREFGIKKKYTENLKELQIKSIYSIFNQGLISDIIPIKYKNKIIAYKLFLKKYSSTPKDWIPAWHGTKIENLESIIKYGLKQQGTKLPNGKIIPKTEYIPLKEVILGIKNWEKAIFATTCISCASMYSFYEIDKYIGFPHSSSLIEIRIRPGSFTKHESKELIGYIYGHDYRSIYHNDTYYRISSENDIAIKSITFISKSFLDMMIKPEDKNSFGDNILKQKKELEDLNNLFSK